MNLAEEIKKQLDAKGELTAADIKNRLRTYRGLNLSQKAISAELKSMRGKGLTRLRNHNMGDESVSVWRPAEAPTTIRNKETVGR